MATTDRLRNYSKTNFRRITAWVLLVAAISVSLALGFNAEQRSITNRQTIHKNVTIIERQCYPLDNGSPSKGCYALAPLIFEACTRRPSVCVSAIESLPAPTVNAFRRAIRRVTRSSSRSGSRNAPQPGEPSTRKGPAGTPRAGPSPGAPSAPPPSQPPPSRPAPQPKPSPPGPSGTINNVVHQGVQQGNQTLCQTVHACGVIPMPPELPPLPFLLP